MRPLSFEKNEIVFSVQVPFTQASLASAAAGRVLRAAAVFFHERAFGQGGSHPSVGVSWVNIGLRTA